MYRGLTRQSDDEARRLGHAPAAAGHICPRGPQPQAEKAISHATRAIETGKRMVLTTTQTAAAKTGRR